MRLLLIVILFFYECSLFAMDGIFQNKTDQPSADLFKRKENKKPRLTRNSSAPQKNSGSQKKNGADKQFPSGIPSIGKNIFDQITTKDAFQKCTKQAVIESAIGPASLDILKYSIRLAKKDSCSSLLLLMNTPGGSLLSTRKMVEVILDSEIPILCLIYPSGAHAGSAGAIIMQACHVNGAVTATNIGAATPIMGSGKDISKDLRQKMINDTTSWLDSLTQLRKRNKQFGRDIVTQAKAVSGLKARQIGAIDFYGQSIEEFLAFAGRQKTQIKNTQNTPVVVGELQSIPLGVRHQLIQFMTDPQMIYLLFIGSLLLLYFEITHPGTIVPGALGGIGLIISFIGMHKLNFVWGGLILILLGVIFMILEAFTAGFGILGSAGAVSFIVGSFFLFDPSKTGGAVIPVSTIILVSLLFIAITMCLAYLAYTALRKKRNTYEWVGDTGEVVEIKGEGRGLMEINGEIWKYRSKDQLKKGDTVKVLCYKKMAFEVAKDLESES